MLENLLIEQPINKEMQSEIKEMIKSGFDLYFLDAIEVWFLLENIYLKDYIRYIHLKTYPISSTFQVKSINGFDLKEILSSPLKVKYETCIKDVFISLNEFYDNLRTKKQTTIPNLIQETPLRYYTTLSEDKPENMLAFYQAVSTLVAYDLFYYPPLRALLRKIFLEKAKISTQPRKGDTPDDPGIHIYNPNYCVKRIKNRPFSKFKGNSILWRHSYF